MHYSGEKLTELILDDNPMLDIKSHSFNGMNQLQYLSLCYMKNLSKINEAAFATLENLTQLKIANNEKLAFIHPGAFEDFQYPFVLRYLNFNMFGFNHTAGQKI